MDNDGGNCFAFHKKGFNFHKTQVNLFQSAQIFFGKLNQKVASTLIRWSSTEVIVCILQIIPQIKPRGTEVLFMATSDRLPSHPTNKDGRATDSCFGLANIPQI